MTKQRRSKCWTEEMFLILSRLIHRLPPINGRLTPLIKIFVFETGTSTSATSAPTSRWVIKDLPQWQQCDNIGEPYKGLRRWRAHPRSPVLLGSRKNANTRYIHLLWEHRGTHQERVTLINDECVPFRK